VNKYQRIIKREARKYGLDPGLIRAQITQESAWDPRAESHCGARGLMQLMPATALEVAEWLHLTREPDLFDPDTNIRLGAAYLAYQIKCFPEIPDALERVKFGLGAYNGGRGYINMAIKLARDDCRRLPLVSARDVAEHRHALHPPGSQWCRDLYSRLDAWQVWTFACRYLADPRCVVRGRRPDHKQITDYVRKIICGWLGSNGGAATKTGSGSNGRTRTAGTAEPTINAAKGCAVRPGVSYGPAPYGVKNRLRLEAISRREAWA